MIDTPHSVRLHDGVDLNEWRAQARTLLLDEVPPKFVTWSEAGLDDLFDMPASQRTDAELAPSRKLRHRVPAEFLSLADDVLCLRDPQRHGVLYRMLWRLTHGEPALLKLLTDDDVLYARNAAKSVHRDVHKMHAFVRFREVIVEGETTPAYIAWFEPQHRIVTRAAPFFARRFSSMRWSILTPDACAHWDCEHLAFTPGADKSAAPGGDALEELWRTYYANIFNPARLKVAAMKSEMPVKYWKNLPEASLIPGLIREAATRMQSMVETPATTPRKRITAPKRLLPVKSADSLQALREAARECRACPLWEPATQTVFGEGPDNAEIVIIGEQPGDREDLSGKPFVGPAGKLLDRALAEAGIDRSRLYVTNTVKHFKFEPRGKARLHKRASSQEQAACRPWLATELKQIKPRAVVCLGGMAATAMFGAGFKLLQERGQWRQLEDGTRAFATVHPSYLLRLPDEAAKQAGFRDFVRDLKLLLDD